MDISLQGSAQVFWKDFNQTSSAPNINYTEYTTIYTTTDGTFIESVSNFVTIVLIVVDSAGLVLNMGTFVVLLQVSRTS